MNYGPEHQVFMPAGAHPGLSELIASLGFVLVNGDGSWYANDPLSVQAIIDSYTPDAALSYAKQEVVVSINAHAMKLRNAAVAGISPAEMAKWQDKYKQALAYQLNPQDASAPDLATEAQYRGCTTAALVAKVIANGQQLTALECAIAGTAGKHRDAINALTEVQAVLSYNWLANWPGV